MSASQIGKGIPFLPLAAAARARTVARIVELEAEGRQLRAQAALYRHIAESWEKVGGYNMTQANYHREQNMQLRAQNHELLDTTARYWATNRMLMGLLLFCIAAVVVAVLIALVALGVFS